VKPGIVRFRKRTDTFTVGAAEAVMVVTFFRIDVPLVGPGIIGKG